MSRFGDALHPSTLQRRFGAVVDSGFYHLFDAGECARFANELPATLRPGGRYYLLAFAVEFPVANTPRRISETDLREHFAEEAGWRMLDVRQAEFRSRIAPVPAVCACIERQAAATVRPA